jgi:hypothetical protein
MNLGYINIGSGVLAVVLASVLTYVNVANAKARTEAAQFIQVVESLQTKLLDARQKLQVQQEKLNKGSAISESVGPAVLADISSVAEKANNPRLRELLLKHRVKLAGSEASGSREGK